MPQWTAEKLRPYQASIFASLGRRAVELNSVNFGQGFPDFDGPEPVKEAAVQAVKDGKNQYAPLSGVPVLNEALSEKYEQAHGVRFDPSAEITVLNGATQAMYAAITAICNPGDEFIVFAPIYDTYVPTVELAGGRAVAVPLKPPTFEFDPDQLAAAVTDKTKAVIINTPHNPTGRVFGRRELEVIRDLCVRHNLIAITDEVYEHLVWDDHQHILLAGLEGMRERTITISSTAKTFSMTGWKIGYVLAPPEPTTAIRRLHQFMTFSVATPLQWGMAEAIRRRDQLIPALYQDLDRKRKALCTGLERIGFKVIPPQGTFFILTDFSPFSDLKDIDFAYDLLENPRICVATIPISVFYMDQSTAPTHFVRFCFAKQATTIDAGLDQLTKLEKRS